VGDEGQESPPRGNMYVVDVLHTYVLFNNTKPGDVSKGQPCTRLVSNFQKYSIW
jgi:hypothetical protein